MRIIRIQKLHIPRKPLPQLLTYYIFLMPFALGFLLDLMKIPSLLKYTIDVAWVSLVFMSLRNKRMHFRRKLLPFVVLSLGFFGYTLVVYLFRFQSVAYYLWGIRNNFRFFAAFFAFSTFLDDSDAEYYFRILDCLFWINVAVSLIQFFMLGYAQDFLGGIFGIEKGGNAYSIVFLSIILCKSILSMMNGSEKILSCMLKCAAALILAVLAELFAFFLVFLLILVVSAVLTKFSWRKCLLYIVMAILLMVCSTFLVELFGSGSAISPDIIVKRMFSENYATSNDLGRLTAIPSISKRILTSLSDRLVGLGLGNCDTSTFEICNTPFYTAHEHLHYTWILSAFLFLETGYVGLALYTGFFVMIFIYAVRKLKTGDNLLYNQIAVIMSLLCVVYTFYNAALRSEAGYMAYFTLALPFVRTSTSKAKQKKGD